MKIGKVLIIVALALIVVGLITFLVVMTVNKWDFSVLSTVKYEEKTYDVQEDFDKISIDVMTDNIEFKPSDGGCRVDLYEAENIKHPVNVVDGTLVIDTEDTRKWYEHIGIFTVTPKMTVYLPKTEFISLTVDVNTGDIKIPNGFTFESIDLNGDTGDVECSANVTKNVRIDLKTGCMQISGTSPENMRLSASTGNIEISSVSVSGIIDANTSTGRVRLKDVTAKDCKIETSTGKIILSDTIATGSFSIENSTGGVLFEDSDAAEIYVKTSTGDVRGTLLSEKIFITKTSTGSIEVPSSTTGGRCEITTSTGSIKISITKQ